MAKINVSQTSELDKRAQEVEKEVSEELSKQKLKESRTKLDKKQVEMKQKIFQFYEEEQQGLDRSFQIEFLEEMLKTTEEMKEAIELTTAVTTALEYVTGTLSFIDEVFDLQTQLLNSTTVHKYGLFSRIGERMRIFRVKRNLINRMNSFATRMASIQSFSTTIMNAFRSSTEKMKRTIAKNNAKNAKKKAKKNVAIDQRDSSTEFHNKLYEEYCSSKGISSNVANNVVGTKINDSSKDDDDFGSAF